MWTYQQSTGKIVHTAKDGVNDFVAMGYSGAPGITKNNPEYQDIHNEGPIPQGKWEIVGLITGQTPHGPYVLHLQPETDTDTIGRDGFLIHGDSFKNPGGASEGCIILGRPVREKIWTSGDRNLEVIS